MQNRLIINTVTFEYLIKLIFYIWKIQQKHHIKIFNLTPFDFLKTTPMHTVWDLKNATLGNYF